MDYANADYNGWRRSGLRTLEGKDGNKSNDSVVLFARSPNDTVLHPTLDSPMLNAAGEDEV